MTPWGLRKRVRAWLFDKLVGEMLNDVQVEAEPEPAPDVEHAEAMSDDAPMLSDEAHRMISVRAPAKESIAPVEEPPLQGSVEERLARLRLR
jgi:hypothetical protein